MARPQTYQPLLLSGGLHASAARTPDKIAILCEERSLSYADLARRVRRVCGAARRAGLRHGDRAAILAPNCIEYAEIVTGLSDAGLIVATLNPRSTAHELTAACDDCGARLLIVHPQLESTVSSTRFGSVERVLQLGPEYESWLGAASEAPPVASVDETDAFTLVYTSGTTGRPKGIMISHRSRTLTFHGMAMEYGCYGPDDLHLGIAPMAHGAGFAFLMASMYFGGTVEVLPKFEPDRVLQKLAAGPFTGVFMVPTHFHSIFALGEQTLAGYRGRHVALRTIISNAAALPQTLKEQIVDFWGPGRLHETYGSTEAGIVTNLRPQHQLTRRQSVGRPFGISEVRLVDDNGEMVAVGSVGELLSRSPYLFNGYWNQPTETAAALHDGWVTAGDLARLDEDGFLYIVDRKKDTIISGGINVYPREIEEFLHRHPAVAEAAVIGVPDDRFGEIPRAYVVIREGKRVTPTELETHCRAVLSGYKVPKDYRFIEVLPRNAGGKVLKTVLREID